MPPFTPLVKDENGISIQIGGSFQTVDGASSPIESPFSLTGDKDVITVPPNAIEFIVNPATNDMHISEDSSLASYDVITKGTKEAIECSRMKFIYVEGAAPSDILNFRFNLS